jgi:hypothetical protein
MSIGCLAISTTIARRLRGHARSRSTNGRTNARARASLNGRVGAEHTNSRTELGSTKRNHVLSDMLSNNLTVLRVGVGENVLDQVVSILITCNVDQWDAWAIKTAFADTVKIATEEVNTTNLEAFLNNLGGKLIHAVLGSIADDMINCSAAVSWGTMLANVLDAPVPELTMSDDIDALKHLFNAGALR